MEWEKRRISIPVNFTTYYLNSKQNNIYPK